MNVSDWEMKVQIMEAAGKAFEQFWCIFIESNPLLKFKVGLAATK